jgi:L-ascorbate metabolism protein UlaG (beta-lactamase superfamily)
MTHDPAPNRKSRNPYYKGPVTDHFDGERFFNPGRRFGKSSLDVVRWMLERKPERWPEHHPSPFSDRPPRRVTGRDFRLSFVGHASFLLQTAGLNLLLDPVWSERASPFSFAGPKRVNVPGIEFSRLPPIDVVLISHNHYDHLDLATLRRLQADHSPKIITPLGNDTIIKQAHSGIRVEAHDWGDHVDLGNGVFIHLEEAYHWSARGVRDRLRALWAAFVIEAPGGRIYHVGDTGYHDGKIFSAIQAKHGEIKLAILPIGAYEPRWFMAEHHMNPEEAVRAFIASGAERALAHHWGTFQLTNEGVTAPPDELRKALQAHKIAEDRFSVLRPGEVLSV